jgi:hypothetical protein
MALLDDLLDVLSTVDVPQVLIGIHWTAVVAEVGGKRRCGLASTLMADHDHQSEPDVPRAGQLETLSGLALASLVKSDSPLE